jgi:FkbM family methyltransferase
MGDTIKMLKQKIKPYIPRFIRQIYRALMNYFKRIGRWLIILVQMRGNSVADEFKLIVSALFSPISSLMHLLKWQNPVLLFDTSVKVFGNGKFNVRAYTDDIWHVLPWRESEITDVTKLVLKKGGVFVDAGANIGVYSILASTLVGKEGKVCSIEMIPNTANRLRGHSQINNCQNISIIEKALSDDKGDIVRAYIPKNRFGMASIEVQHDDKDTELVEVKTDTLDNILTSYERIDLMKMDLEGAELKALHGATDVIAKTKNIIFETHTQMTEIIELLEKQGFIIKTLSGRDMLASRQSVKARKSKQN